MRVTVDTNFLISATQWDTSVSHKLLRKLIIGDVKIFTTKEILEEFSKVLQRDFEYESEEIKHILESVLPFLTLIKPQRKRTVVKDDPDDDKIIECAIGSNSQYVITYDKHLLSLKEYQGIRIIKPEELINQV